MTCITYWWVNSTGILCQKPHVRCNSMLEIMLRITLWLH